MGKNRKNRQRQHQHSLAQHRAAAQAAANAALPRSNADPTDPFAAKALAMRDKYNDAYAKIMANKLQTQEKIDQLQRSVAGMEKQLDQAVGAYTALNALLAPEPAAAPGAPGAATPAGPAVATHTPDPADEDTDNLLDDEEFLDDLEDELDEEEQEEEEIPAIPAVKEPQPTTT